MLFLYPFPLKLNYKPELIGILFISFDKSFDLLHIVEYIFRLFSELLFYDISKIINKLPNTSLPNLKSFLVKYNLRKILSQHRILHTEISIFQIKISISFHLYSRDTIIRALLPRRLEVMKLKLNQP